jgi:hypothetical protein
MGWWSVKKFTKFYFVIFIMLFSILSACGQESTGGSGSGSYSISVYYGDKEYTAATTDTQDYDKIELIGTVSRKIPKENVPTQNGESNFFVEGTKIYSIVNEEFKIYLEQDGDSFILTSNE